MHVDFLFVMHLLLLSVSFSKHVETEIAAARKKQKKKNMFIYLSYPEKS